jgi:hypothetical protein
MLGISILKADNYPINPGVFASVFIISTHTTSFAFHPQNSAIRSMALAKILPIGYIALPMSIGIANN